MAIDPTITTAALAACEASVNQALQYDPGTRLALAELEGQVLAVDISTPAATIYVCFNSDGVQLLGIFEGSVSTRLRGSAVALILLMSGGQTSLANSGVEVFGSTSLLSKLQGIARNIDIDWEEPLTQLLGDLLGHQSAEYIRWRCNYITERVKAGLRLGSEFLTEENRSLPATAEVEFFCDQVDQLRLDADRAQAKLQALLARAKNASTSTKHS